MLVAMRKEDQNEAAIDPWTFVHAGTGLALGLIGVKFQYAFAAAVLYELIEAKSENTERVRSFFNVSAPETTVNQIVDVAVFSLGLRLGSKWNQT